MTETVDVVIVGAGLGGLGTAYALAHKYHQRVIILEATIPQFDGNDRFDPAIGASFKHAGMLELGIHGQGVHEYFAAKTLDHYRAAGVELKESQVGAHVVSRRQLKSLGNDDNLVSCTQTTFHANEPNIRPAAKRVAKYTFCGKGSIQAEAEATMRILMEKIQKESGIKLLFDHGVTRISYDDKDKWTIDTLHGQRFRCGKLVLAAGPQTRALMEKHLKLTIKTNNVLALQAQSSYALPTPWLQGILIGAESSNANYNCYMCCGPPTTQAAYLGNGVVLKSWLNESTAWCSRLHLNVHDEMLYLGGSRILLPDRYTTNDLNPRMYAEHAKRDLEAAKSLVALPTLDINNFWTGVMVVPSDMEYPLVGPVDRLYDERLFLNTGHNAVGFREAYGAGVLCADMCMSGLQAVSAIKGHGFQLDWKAVLPKFGSRVTRFDDPFLYQSQSH